MLLLASKDVDLLREVRRNLDASHKKFTDKCKNITDEIINLKKAKKESVELIATILSNETFWGIVESEESICQYANNPEFVLKNVDQVTHHESSAIREQIKSMCHQLLRDMAAIDRQKAMIDNHYMLWHAIYFEEIEKLTKISVIRVHNKFKRIKKNEKTKKENNDLVCMADLIEFIDDVLRDCDEEVIKEVKSASSSSKIINSVACDGVSLVIVFDGRELLKTRANTYETILSRIINDAPRGNPISIWQLMGCEILMESESNGLDGQEDEAPTPADDRDPKNIGYFMDDRVSMRDGADDYTAIKKRLEEIESELKTSKNDGEKITELKKEKSRS